MKTSSDYQSLSDAELVAYAQAQLPYQTMAYEALMRRHQSKMYALCLKTVRNTEDAQDLTQDVMLKVFHNIKGFSGHAKISTWLYSVASNTCLDYLRKHQRTTAQHVPIEDGHHVAMHNNDDARILVNNALASLDENDQMIINLRFTVGLSLDEIAEVLTLKVSATKMRYYRAMDKLKEQVVEK